MLTLARRFRLFPVLTIVLNAAGIVWIHHDLTGGRQSRLRVLAALPARDVDRTDRFSLVFDEAVVAASSVGTGVLDSPFSVHPMVPGRWQWAAPDKLEYLLDTPLPPGRRFTVKANHTLERLTGRRLVGPGEFRFQTRALRLEDCSVTSADRALVTLELRFNQPVNPTDLLAQVRLTDGENKALQSVRCLSQDAADKLTLQANRPAGDSLHIHLNAQLAGHGAELPLGRDVDEVRELKPRFALLSAEPQVHGLNPAVTVTLKLSRQLLRDQPTPAVHVTPAVGGLQTRLVQSAIVLEGPFQSGVTYTASVSGNLLARNREALGEDQSVTFDLPDREPSVAFDQSHGILSPTGNLLVDLKTVNVDGLHIRASHLHANNLIAHLRGEAAAATAREFPLKSVVLQTTKNVPAALSLDLRELLGKPLGIYTVQASATKDTWNRDAVVVAVTDLAITAKSGRDGWLVWVTSLSQARPVGGAEVRALSFNNQVLASAVSDERGLARLKIAAGHPDGPLYAIVAGKGEDLSFLRPEQAAWSLDDVDVSGRPAPESYDVMLYTERGVYRPGETIHLTGIIRDASGASPTPFPLSVTVTRPDGRDVSELSVTPAADREGLFHVDCPVLDDGHLGPYRFRVHLPGAKETLGRASALVEEYLPARLELKAQSLREQFAPSESISFHITGRYLFDQPAADLPVVVSGTFRPISLRSKRYPDFVFAPDERKSAPLKEFESKLDVDGRATIEIPDPPQSRPGLWQLDGTVTLREEGGRSITTHVACVKDMVGRFVGLHMPAGRVIDVAAPVDVDWVQLTGRDEPAEPGGITYTLQRVTTETQLEEVNGRYVWKSAEFVTPVDSGEIAATGSSGHFSVTCPMPGHFRLQAIDCLSGGAASIEFDAAASGQTTSLAGGKPARVDLTFDQAGYTAGSTARLLVRSPFAGTMLLTIESDRVLLERIVDLNDTETQIELPVDAAWRGGAFVTAALVRRIEASEASWLPHCARGVARLQIDHPASRLAVELQAPDRAEPSRPVSIQVATHHADGSVTAGAVHVWAVDEGILATTGYQTPDPAAHFFARRKLEVSSADLFDELLPDYLRPAGITRIGGDGADDEEESARRSPVAAPRRAPTIIWQQVVPLGADGSAVFSVTLPQHTGELRWMAVAVAGDAYGSAQRAMTLTSPLLVEVSSPRFAAPDDRFVMPARIFNTTGSPLTVALRWHVEGPARIEQVDATQTFTVQPGQPVTTWWRTQTIGLGPVSARLVASTTGGEKPLRSESTATFAVRPAGPLHTDSRLLRVKAGEHLQIPALDLFIPGTVRRQVTVSANPNLNLLPALDQLLEYPYGCVEQTTSRLYALLYAPDLLRTSSQARADAVADMIRAGIARLWSMQTRSGGLAYWPGGREADLWGTMYAAEWLVQARTAGYAADARLLGGIADYLQQSNAATGNEAPDDDTRADLCYVLGMLGRPAQGWLSRLSELVDQLDLGGRAHLAGTWMEVGRKDRALAVLPKDLLDATFATTTTGGRLTSAVREQAVLLRVLLDLDREHAWIPQLVARLEAARKAGSWGSTLENASALAALARYQTLQREPANFQGVLRSASMSPRPFSSGAAETVEFDQATEPIELDSSGQGDISVCVATQGLLRDPAGREYDRQLKVSRQWTDRHGQVIDPAKIRVGDLILVETSISAPGLSADESVSNVAIVDGLPGGMEVENPRLITSEQGTTQIDPADRVEFRDDRVVVFTSVEKKARTIRYALRAITAGSFALPPIEASCMYDAGYASIRGGARVEIAR